MTSTTASSRPGRNRVVILSDALWRARFNGDPTIVGRDITLNTRAYQVIGVMPPQVRFPSPDAQMWTPFVMTPETAALRRPHLPAARSPASSPACRSSRRAGRW